MKTAGLIVNATTRTEGLCRLGIALLILFAVFLVALPIYCIRHSKIILKNKIKKYIYPFIFSICFFVTYIILAIVLEIVLPSGDYAGLAYAFIVLLIWILVVIPIYCFKYSKLICEEKWIFLFIIFNSLVIALCHTGPILMGAIPNGDADIIIKITLALFGWIALCTYVSYLIRINTTKEPYENNSNETQG